MNLPHSAKLPVHHLASAFSKTTNSYKFYWLLAILENVKKGKQLIDTKDLIIEMIGEVWYPINIFRLSFSKQDKFDFAIREIQQALNCSSDIKKEELQALLKQLSEKKEIQNLINHLGRYVPKRFLSPWFNDKLRGLKDAKKDGVIMELAERHFNRERSSMYRFLENGQKIELNGEWLQYLNTHLSIITGYTYWHLTNYLQKNNPNVPNIPAKLFPPEKRKLDHAREFWSIYFSERHTLNCIYSNIPIAKSYSIDHFLPWSFVGHDQLWNLLPTVKEVNSSKGDRLPAKRYLKEFFELQFDAFHLITQKKPSSKKLIEDYAILLNKTLDEIKQIPKTDFIHSLENTIKPQMQIAMNMGFQPNWEYHAIPLKGKS